MIQISVLTHDSLLKELRVTGHAQTQSVCCAAVSVLVQSVSGAISTEELSAGGRADAPGEFFLSIGRPQGEWLRGLTSTFLSGVYAVLREYPEELRVEIVEE